MSGHNPHGRLGQPNPPWNNHLQVPSYIPRQPQVAHMSNERPMVRSPLTWHTPTHNEPALYNYMTAATHKTPLDINPLLPVFVRPPIAPVGSVDLSIASAGRHNTTPSPRSIASPVALVNDIPAQPGNGKSLNSSLIGCVGVIQSTGSAKDKSTTLSTNLSNGGGSDCSSSPVAISAPLTGLFVRDARQINNDILTRTARELQSPSPLPLPNQQHAIVLTPSLCEPIQLIKENTYHNLETRLEQQKTSIVSSKSKSPNRGPWISHLEHLHHDHELIGNIDVSRMSLTRRSDAALSDHGRHRSPSTPTSELPPPPAPTSILSTSANFHSTSSSCSLSSISSTSSMNDSLKNSSPIKDNHSVLDDNCVDGTTTAGAEKQQTRRRRKPNKTTRMSNSDTDDCIIRTNNNKNLAAPIELIVPAKPPSLESSTENSENSKNIATASQNDISQNPAEKRIEETVQPVIPMAAVQELPAVTTDSLNDHDIANDSEKHPTTQTIPTEDTGTKETSSNPVIPPVPDVDTNTTAIKSAEATQPSPQRSPVRLTTSPVPVPVPEPPTIQSSSPCPGKRKIDENNSDDGESIDNIAAMIASTSPEFNEAKNRNCAETLKMKPVTISLVPITMTAAGRHHLQQRPDSNGESSVENLKEILGIGQTEKAAMSPPSKVTKSAPDPAQAGNCYEEVEHKLEEMFAGIEDDRPAPSSKAADSHANSSTCKNDNATSGTTKTKLSIKSKVKKPATASSSSSPKLSAQKKRFRKKVNTKNGKKGNEKKRGRPTKGNNFTEKKTKKEDVTPSAANVTIVSQPVETTLRSRGPFVHVNIDGSTSVINAPIAEDVAESKAKLKKGFVSQTNNDRSKVRGLHLSTLSMKYDADTTDKTWICVFCKMGPHRFGLGDLFGPNIVTTTCEDYQMSQTEANDVFKSKRNRIDMVQKRELPAGPSGIAKKKRNTNGHAIDSPNQTVTLPTTTLPPPRPPPPPADIFFGMTKASDDSYEVWMHEDCAVWSPGVHIVGVRLIGLEAAVWNSAQHTCRMCGNNGAMLCCQKRGCALEVHLPCARNTGWQLIDEDFKCLCDIHHVVVSAAASTTTTTTTTKAHEVSVQVASTSSAS